MYVCCCAAVPQKTWDTALEMAQGDVEKACSATGAGLGCGGCREFLKTAAVPVRALVPPDAPARLGS